MIQTQGDFSVMGDAASVSELRRGVMLVVRQRVRNAALAEDVCNEAFKTVVERLAREPLDDPSRLPAFLAQTARNLAIAEWRKTLRRRTVTGEDEVIASHEDAAMDAGDGVQQRQRAEAVRAVLAELPTPRDRELLVRYYLRDEDKEDICRHLGLTEAHFNRVIFRARERFRTLLEARYTRADLYCLAL
jgi:RNA polymerase sigma-70 factor, ECF subfamily